MYRWLLPAFLAAMIFSPAYAEELNLWEWEPGAKDGQYEGVFKEEDRGLYHFLNSESSAYLSGFPRQVCDRLPSGKLVNCRMPWRVKTKETQCRTLPPASLSLPPSSVGSLTLPSTSLDGLNQTEQPLLWGVLPCQPAEPAILLTAGQEREKDTQGIYRFTLSGRSEGQRLLASMTCKDYLFNFGAGYWRYPASVALSNSTRPQQLNIERYDSSLKVYKHLVLDSLPLPQGVSLFLGLGAGVESLPTFDLVYSRSNLFPYFVASYTTFQIAYP